MTEHHTITPPPELVKQWLGEFFGCTVSGELSDSERFFSAHAAQWGADQELEAVLHLCDEWLTAETIRRIRAARRPKPQTLNSIALEMLGTIEKMDVVIPEITDTIRRALEALPDD